jgi:hypothetical protein
MDLRFRIASGPEIPEENVRISATVCRGGGESTVNDIEPLREHAERRLDGVRETANENLQAAEAIHRVTDPEDD